MSKILFAGFQSDHLLSKTNDLYHKMIALNNENESSYPTLNFVKWKYSFEQRCYETISEDYLCLVIICYNLLGDLIEKIKDKIKEYGSNNKCPPIIIINMIEKGKINTGLKFEDLNLIVYDHDLSVDINTLDHCLDIASNIIFQKILWIKTNNMVKKLNEIHNILSATITDNVNDVSDTDTDSEEEQDDDMSLIMADLPLIMADVVRMNHVKFKINQINSLFDNITYDMSNITLNMNYYHVTHDVDIIIEYYTRHGYICTIDNDNTMTISWARK